MFTVNLMWIMENVEMELHVCKQHKIHGEVGFEASGRWRSYNKTWLFMRIRKLGQSNLFCFGMKKTFIWFNGVWVWFWHTYFNYGASYNEKCISSVILHLTNSFRQRCYFSYVVWTWQTKLNTITLLCLNFMMLKRRVSFSSVGS